MNALVVDESQRVRATLSRILREIGFEVLEAVHARDALEILRRLQPARPFGVALVDGDLPERGGFAFVEGVRADATYDGVKLVMVAAGTETSSVALALEAGVDEYVMKPFTREIILEKLALLGLVVP